MTRFLHRRLWALAVVVCGGLLAAAPVHAQGTDRFAQLVSTARTALDDLEYTRAVAACRAALQQPGISREQRIEVLKIMAAAQFPNDPDAYKPDSAKLTLRALVKADLDATFPRGLGWRGLDSLLAVVKGTVLSVAVAPLAEQRVQGGEGTWAVPFRSTVDASWRLVAERNGVTVPLATGRGVSGELTVPAIKDRAPLLAAGDWALVITARTEADSESVKLTATLATDTLNFVDLPKFDSAQVKPEVAPPIKGKAVLYGLLLGGATAAIANGVRAEDPVRSAYAADSRAMGVAAGLAVGASLAMVLDKGRALPANAEANAALRQGHERLMAEAVAENDRRLAAAVTTVRIVR
jgi:hypothetical protein